eukprot:scaffold2691_cov417-Prasinococcus_capsulatus_cf.AAC.12
MGPPATSRCPRAVAAMAWCSRLVSTFLGIRGSFQEFFSPQRVSFDGAEFNLLSETRHEKSVTVHLYYRTAVVPQSGINMPSCIDSTIWCCSTRRHPATGHTRAVAIST